MEHNSNNGRATTVELLRTWEGYGCVHEWVLRVGRALMVSVGAPRGWQTEVGGCWMDALSKQRNTNCVLQDIIHLAIMID